MKKAIRTLLLPLLTSTLMAGAGPGPWGQGAYYPGYLDGKYVATVTGNNISGVLGFGISDGAPPFRTFIEQNAVIAGDAIVIEENTTIQYDQLQNYFAIFVAGRVYTGKTSAGINIEDNSVAGALMGEEPLAMPPFTALAGTNAVANSLPIVNRGLSGGFTAKIKQKQAALTFKGSGQLSTPANTQTVNLTAVPIVANPLVPPTEPAGTITNLVTTGQVVTDTTCFQLSGIRTSPFSRSPTASSDASGESAAGGGAGGGGGGGG